MGLFSNKKKLCPICDSPTPRFFSTVVDGMPICKECKKKINLPDGTLDTMTMDDFRQYMVFYQENQTLRDAFNETFFWDSIIYIDMTNRLFRLSSKEYGLGMEASNLVSFRILEDDYVLFESSAEGLRCYESNTPARAEELAPVVAQFRMQMDQFNQMEEMKKNMNEQSGGDSMSSTYISRPQFEIQLIKNGFTLELTLQHPYWNGTHSWTVSAPRFDDSYPSVNDFMRSYKMRTSELHDLAANLMSFIDPNAQEVYIPLGSSVRSAETRAVYTADPVEEIQRYKALLDSGVITEEEFAAKKRQIMGI